MLPAEDNNSTNRFTKHDRLKSPLAIEALYRENQLIVSYPLKCYYSFSERKEPESLIRVAFTVPKKTFKKAVERNKLKRRMREIYRLNYRKILENPIFQNDKQLKLFFIYIGKEMLEFNTIERSLIAIFQEIDKKIYFCAP
ncbi:MAG: ribonuclease P protein component [Bacteroidales bacterium]|jgi:ribonuclease P protein component|nr:ribonuclease P protein component [Bacteroidales bacterium]